MFPPLLAAPFEGVMGIILFIIAVIGWIVQLANSQNNPPPPQRRRRPDRARGNRKTGEEIERLMREARQGGRAQANAGNRPRGGGGADEIEILEPGRARRQAPQRRPPQRPAPKRRRTREEIYREQVGLETPADAQVVEPAPARRGRRSRDTQRREATSSEAAHREISSIADTHLAPSARQALPHAVDQSVSNHLGTFSGMSAFGEQGLHETTANRAFVAKQLVANLLSKQGIRTAILANELLSPPMSRRKGRRSLFQQQSH